MAYMGQELERMIGNGYVDEKGNLRCSVILQKCLVYGEITETQKASYINDLRSRVDNGKGLEMGNTKFSDYDIWFAYHHCSKSSVEMSKFLNCHINTVYRRIGLMRLSPTIGKYNGKKKRIILERIVKTLNETKGCIKEASTILDVALVNIYKRIFGKKETRIAKELLDKMKSFGDNVSIKALDGRIISITVYRKRINQRGRLTSIRRLKAWFILHKWAVLRVLVGPNKTKKPRLPLVRYREK